MEKLAGSTGSDELLADKLKNFQKRLSRYKWWKLQMMPKRKVFRNK